MIVSGLRTTSFQTDSGNGPPHESRGLPVGEGGAGEPCSRSLIMASSPEAAGSAGDIGAECSEQNLVAEPFPKAASQTSGHKVWLHPRFRGPGLPVC